jgi:hypothetical protein
MQAPAGGLVASNCRDGGSPAAPDGERSAAEIALGPDLRATNQEIRHEDCGYRRHGLIGKKLVNNLRQHGHEVVAASPSSGVNAHTGEGLAEVLAGAQVVVDVSNSPSFEDWLSRSIPQG